MPDIPSAPVEHILPSAMYAKYDFIDAAVAASQTNVQLGRPGSTVEGVPMMSVTRVVGMAWKLSAAATAGSLTIGVTNDGTELTTTTQTITTAAEGTIWFSPADNTLILDADDDLGVEITTDGTWNATTENLHVDIYVVHYMVPVTH